ncbi:hypothetical protein A3K42_00125 [candidate division WWE3 bacterium RBG_13_37_7]|uniref:Probable transcriptional regulatory protein A3K42_00125 n=1 Tax=candidate division WWE3 bacterium RBG_13_37_7 TaxID=1802609 RepID=A0A1F4U1F6_UNCKA|nr:MAG: hypothetical protein A3K42_00125 [candidate division WWE3 bacterium RBG_13_37_7]
MSGHSKWANIKRDKAVNDAKRSNMFTKLSRLISVAARQSGGDPDANPALRLAIEKAKRDGRMPKDTIDKAIARGAGRGADATSLEEITYEGFGPNGEAFYIKAITDNRNRTVAELRNIFSKAGGSLGGAGSTAYIFSPDPETPNFTIDIGTEEQYKKLEELYDQLEDHDDVQQVYTNFDL